METENKSLAKAMKAQLRVCEIVVDDDVCVVVRSVKSDVDYVGHKANNKVYMYVPIHSHDINISSWLSIDGKVVPGAYKIYAGCVVVECNIDHLPKVA